MRARTISYKRYSECTWFVFIHYCYCISDESKKYLRRRRCCRNDSFNYYFSKPYIQQTVCTKYSCEIWRRRWATCTDWLTCFGREELKSEKKYCFLLFSVRLSTFGKHLNQFFLLACCSVYCKCRDLYKNTEYCFWLMSSLGF